MEPMNNQFIHADSDKCIGCLNCELACSASHTGVSVEEAYEMLINNEPLVPARNEVIKFFGKTAPVQCRQCEDAPCLKVCPIEIIYFQDNFVKYFESDCIGCKNCAMVCPYGMVIMAPNHKEDAPLSNLVALTCDLCGGTDEVQACVEICPTDAISLINYKSSVGMEVDNRLK